MGYVAGEKATLVVDLISHSPKHVYNMSEAATDRQTRTHETLCRLCVDFGPDIRSLLFLICCMESIQLERDLGARAFVKKAEASE